MNLDTFEPKYSAISVLLKFYKIKLSAVKANRYLLALGILEERQRESTAKPGTFKTYRVLTEEGLKYGVNVTSPHNKEEKVPHYELKKFFILAKMLEEYHGKKFISSVQKLQKT